MLDYQTSIIYRTLPDATFGRLRNLWQQMAQLIGQGAVVVTEDVLSSVEVSQKQGAQCFAVLVSERFNAMLLGEPSGGINNSSFFQVGLSFSPQACAAFLTGIEGWLENSPVTLKVRSSCVSLQPNDATLQSKFTLALVEILSPVDGNAASKPDPAYTQPSVCKPVEDALRQQVEQERLLNQVITQMHQSLELPVILTTAVEQVRHFLQVDRLVIYQFEVDIETLRTDRNNRSGEETPAPPIPGRGCVTYESLASDTIPSVLHWAEEKHCFVDVPNLWEKYRQGFICGVDDIETTYAKSACFVQLMRETQVRAKIVVPIVVREELWGLLIAHQCYDPRRWQESEKTFLQHIGEHLAIAIYQATLYTQVQQQKLSLEARVSERTSALHDALLLAESANRSKTEFLAAMSHELRTPLTCVIGLSATLLRWHFGELSQKQQGYLQLIHDSGEHLLELINEILELSQLEAGRAVLNISDFSLSKLAQQCLVLLKDKVNGSGVNLKIELQLQPASDRFTADFQRVKQILLHLLTNAVKFTSPGGRVTLRVWVEDNTAVLQVEDTGIGIPEEQRELLFQKFQQLDSSYHRNYEGIGLGLALTKQWVELHGGWIEVESTVGVGSTFTVWLPARCPDSAGKLPDADSSRSAVTPILDSPPGQIILIEDDEQVATLICDILTAAGYQLVWLLEGSNAVEQIRLLQPTAVILDLDLPEKSGEEIIHCLRSTPATASIKALVLTAKEMPELQHPGLAAGVDDYLPKPVQPEQLLHKVGTLMAT